MEALSLHENGVDLRDILKAEVPTVARKDDVVRVRIGGASLGLQFADKELVEAGEGVRDERGDQLAAGGTRHAAAVPAGEELSLDEMAQDRATRGFVGKTQPGLPVDSLGFEGAGFAIKVAHRLHEPTLPLA